MCVSFLEFVAVLMFSVGCYADFQFDHCGGVCCLLAYIRNLECRGSRVIGCMVALGGVNGSFQFVVAVDYVSYLAFIVVHLLVG